jgi:hypothetical protein
MACDFICERRVPMSDQDGAMQFVNWLFEAFHAHNYIFILGAVLSLVTAIARNVVPKMHDKLGEFVNSTKGKGVLVLFLSEIGAISTALMTGQFSSKTLVDGMVVAFFTAGGYGLLKPLLEGFLWPPNEPVVGSVLKDKNQGGSATVGVITALGLLFAVFGLFITLVGCTGCGPMTKKIGVDVAACANGLLPQAVADVLPEVEASLAGTSTNWQNEVSKLEKSGIDFAICCVEGALNNLYERVQKPSTTQTTMMSAGSPLTPLAKGRAEGYLSAHGIKLIEVK